MLMGSSYTGGETMFPERESGRARRGGKKSAAAEQKANKQPQRGLGVAQLEKIRLHNQMMAAHRSGGMHLQDDDGRIMQQVPFAAPSAELVAGSPPFQQPYHAADRGIVGVQYYGKLQACSSSRSPSLLAHDVRRDSSGQGTHPPQQHYCVTCTGVDESSNHGGAEELDLELRL